MTRRLKNSLFAAVTALVAGVATGHGQTFAAWLGGGPDGNFSTAENWDPATVPTGEIDQLFFVPAGPEGVTINNDLTGVVFHNIAFLGGTYIVDGNAFTEVERIGDALYGNLAYHYTFNTAIVGSDRLDFEFGDGAQALTFTNSVTLGVDGADVYGYHNEDNAIVLSGNGTLTSPTATNIRLADATLAIDNNLSEVADRISDNVTVQLYDGGRLAFSGNAFVDSFQTVENVDVLGSGTITAGRFVGGNDASLTIGNLTQTEGSLTLFQSEGVSSNVLGAGGLGIFLEGAVDSDFLGPQNFYLSDSVGNGIYQYAAYDTTRGVIAVESSLDDLETAAEGTNVVVTEDVTTLSGDTEALNSVALNGRYIDGPGTLKVTHLLLTLDGSEVTAAVDFGDNDGTITTENWETEFYPEVAITGEIRGTGSLTTRGLGVLDVVAEASFSGELKVLSEVNLAEGGSFAEVSALQIGAADSRPGIINLRGSDAGENVNRLSDTAAITADGIAEIALYADDDSGIAVSETIGGVTANAGAELTLAALAHIYDGSLHDPVGHDPAKAATLTVTSLEIDSNALTPTTVILEARSGGSAVVVGGAVIDVQNSDTLVYKLYGDETRIQTNGVRISNGMGLGETPGQNANATVIVSTTHSALPGETATLVGDFDLADGNLYFLSESDPTDAFVPGQLTLDGDLKLGAGAEMYLLLGSSDDGVTPYFTLTGDLTIGGTLNVASRTDGFIEGSRWLLFEVGVTGSIIDNGWTIDGLDGNYGYTVEGNQVYLNAVPEPATSMMLLLGFGAVLVLRRQRRVA